MFKKYLKFKNLSKQKKLVHGIFDKNFGNLSLKYGSKKEVEKNKKNVAKILNINGQKIFSLNQIHSSKVKIIKKDKNFLKEEKADALVTNQRDIFLMIKTADCFPVLMFDPRQEVMAAIHVGWRGAIEKIFLNVLLKMITNFNCRPQDILVAIGPGMGPCCFKHRHLIQEKLPDWQEFIKVDKNDWRTLNLRKFIEDKLIEAGIRKNNIETMDICNSCNATPNNKYSGQRFFSHLRSLNTGEPEGRFATIIGLND